MTDRLNRTPLHYAAAEGDVDQVKDLLGAGSEVNVPDAQGWTPLHFAAQASSAAVAELLIQAGAEVDATDHHGNSPLYRAVFNSRGDGSVISILRKAGANASHSNSYGVTPLSLARSIGNYDLARFFADLP
jgi:ankyrin repeat protein